MTITPRLTPEQIAEILTPWLSDFIVLSSRIDGFLFFGTYQAIGAQGLSRIVKNTLDRWYGTYFRQIWPQGVQFKISPTIKSPTFRDPAGWRKEYSRLTTTLPGLLNRIGVNPGVSGAALKILNDLYQYININAVTTPVRRR